MDTVGRIIVATGVLMGLLGGLYHGMFREKYEKGIYYLLLGIFIVLMYIAKL